VSRRARPRVAVLVLLAVLVVACAPSRPSPRVLRVGSSGDYAPFSMRDEVDWIGFDVEVARRFAHDTGRRVEFVEFRWPALELDLAANRFDVAMSGVTMRPWRARVGTFTRPIARVGAIVLVRPGLARTLAELDVAGHRVGVNQGGYLERVARRLFRRADIVPVGDNRQLAAELRRGAVDALVSDELEAPIFRRVVPDADAIGPLTNDRKAYLARDAALADELDAWLRAREVDGSLAAFRARMLGPQWGVPHDATASDLDALLALIELRLAFMPSVALAKEQRGLPTTDAAQEADVVARARERAVLVGAPPERVVALFDALVAAARHIQDAFRALPAAGRPAVEAMDLESEARPALARISATIVDRAADVARGKANPVRPTPAVIADALDASLAPPDDRLAIATAVAALLPGN
jgi:cyclohexadienyl dehydratase